MMPRPDGLPAWFEPLLTNVAAARSEDFYKMRPPVGGGRASAVLVLLGEGADEPGEPDLLVLQRAASMRNHAGQPAFPGGAADPEDADRPATALREAKEEVGLDPSSATVLALLPELWIPVSSFLVTPVLAWWNAPHPVYPCQPAEVAGVERLPIRDLVDPANRIMVSHPSGFVSPAFTVGGMVVWGFTAGVISVLLELGGWARPWDTDRVVPLPPADAPVPAPGGAAPDEVVP